MPPGIALTVRVAFLVPVLRGWKWMSTVHDSAPASPRPVQLSVPSTNCVASLEATVRPPLGAPPVFMTVKVTSALSAPATASAKVCMLGVSDSAGGVTAVPVRFAVRVRVVAPTSMTRSVAVALPAACGVKATLMSQLAPAARATPSQPSVPLVKPVPVRRTSKASVGALPALLTVKVRSGLSSPANVGRSHSSSG